MILFVGLFISLEPTIFNLNPAPSDTPATKTSSFSLIFIGIFALSWLPSAFAFVFMEIGQKGYEVTFDHIKSF